MLLCYPTFYRESIIDILEYIAKWKLNVIVIKLKKKKRRKEIEWNLRISYNRDLYTVFNIVHPTYDQSDHTINQNGRFDYLGIFG